MFCKRIFFWVIVFSVVLSGVRGQELLGDKNSGSRTPSVHVIQILDEQGQLISPDDRPALPFSTEKTCGVCHDVESISKGWHFNSMSDEVDHGRPGQPWIFIDKETGTQVPLSYRNWPGTFEPGQFGISDWDYVKRFGRQMTGGGVGKLENIEDIDLIMRSFVSGNLEINCLSCHDHSDAHDQTQYGTHISRENFRWAAAATADFAYAEGFAADMPDTFDIIMPDVFDDPTIVPPAIRYNPNAFNHRNEVFFNVGGQVRNESCYFCHSNSDTDKEKWQITEDVHMAAGLSCSDCHRHGLDHNVIRGYEGESAGTGIESIANAYTCQGCHIGTDEDLPRSGTFAAPFPNHAGMPEVHFDKLSCTACHSGPWLEDSTILTQTSRAHGLGTHNASYDPNALPHINTPVYAAGVDGKIAPHKQIWPSYWAQISGEQIIPLDLNVVRSITARFIEQTGEPGWAEFDKAQVRQIIDELQNITGEKVGYISGGKLLEIGQLEELEIKDHPAAEPYMWAFGHDVRPAAQAIGVRGCGDCHSMDAGFTFADVNVSSPVPILAGRVMEMSDFQESDRTYMKIFAATFIFRPFLKTVSLLSAAVIAAILLLYGLRALEYIATVFRAKL